MRFDGRLDDDHVVDNALLPPALGGADGLLAGALEHQPNIARLERILDRERGSKQRQPEWRRQDN